MFDAESECEKENENQIMNLILKKALSASPNVIEHTIVPEKKNKLIAKV